MTVSAAITAAGGGFYAQYFLFIDSGIAFGPWISVEALLAPIIGGIGTAFGPLLGALVVKTLGELAKVVTGDATDGNSARNLLYGPGYKTVDLALSRDFSLSERFKLRFRAEATNAFNHVDLGQPGAGVPAAGTTSASFGVITSANSMRKMQFGVRLTF